MSEKTVCLWNAALRRWCELFVCKTKKGHAKGNFWASLAFIWTQKETRFRQPQIFCKKCVNLPKPSKSQKFSHPFPYGTLMFTPFGIPLLAASTSCFLSRSSFCFFLAWNVCLFSQTSPGGFLWLFQSTLAADGSGTQLTVQREFFLNFSHSLSFLGLSPFSFLIELFSFFLSFVCLPLPHFLLSSLVSSFSSSLIGWGGEQYLESFPQL